MPDYKYVSLSLFQKLRLISGNVNSQDFVNIAGSSIEEQVSPGEYFVFKGDPSARLFLFNADDKGSYITTDRPNAYKIYLYKYPKSDAGILEKFKQSEVVQTYNMAKDLWENGHKRFTE